MSGLEAQALGLAPTPWWRKYCERKPWWAEIADQKDPHGVALRLLITNLSPAQVQQFTADQYFEVVGSAGGLWELHWNDLRSFVARHDRGPHYSLKRTRDDLKPCILMSDEQAYARGFYYVPQGDNLLALMLALQADEERLAGASMGRF